MQTITEYIICNKDSPKPCNIMIPYQHDKQSTPGNCKMQKESHNCADIDYNRKQSISFELQTLGKLTAALKIWRVSKHLLCFRNFTKESAKWKQRNIPWTVGIVSGDHVLSSATLKTIMTCIIANNKSTPTSFCDNSWSKTKLPGTQNIRKTVSDC